MKGAIDSARIAAFAAVLAASLLAETLRSARSWSEPRSRRILVHLALAGMNTAALRLLVSGPIFLWVCRVRAQGWGASGLLGIDGPAEILASLACFDAFDYFWHRASHRLAPLWRFHRVHHSDTHVDATTSLRFHVGELLLSAMAKALWILAWGPSAWAFALCEMEVTAASQFHHSNVDLPERWERRLRPLIMTPRVHASHHTVGLRTRDANFSTVLSVWDRLFGTFRKPDRAEMERLGLPEGREEHLSLPAMLRAPFKD